MKLGLVFLAAGVSGTNYMSENFNDDGWKTRWTLSTWKPESEIGEWTHTAGKWSVDDADKGIKTGQDARFYGISAKLSEPFSNKDKDMAISYMVKHEQNIDCGGAYIKLLPSGLDASTFGGDSPYAIMFGPDICGGNKHTHAILNYARPNAEAVNMDHQSKIEVKSDHHAHLYTFILRQDNTYEVLIDGESKQSGNVAENWPFQPEKEIEDPEQSKPEDWVDLQEIPDPADTKPEGYDDIPAQIPDPDAKKPEDWDDEDDGDWEPPMVDNPDYNGPWQPRMMDNPDYKGEWVHPKIANPDYFEDDGTFYHRCNPCEHVGFELWQVKSGTLFDDILVTDDMEALAQHTTTVMEKITALKEMKDKLDEEQAKIAQEEAKAKEEAGDKEDEEEEEDEVDEKDEL